MTKVAVSQERVLLDVSSSIFPGLELYAGQVP